MQDVEVLCLPTSGVKDISIEKLPLLETAKTDHLDESEKRLQYIPNVFGHLDWRDHGGTDRCLVNIGNMRPDQDSAELENDPAPYLLYKCTRESAGCLPNKTFEIPPDVADSGSTDAPGSTNVDGSTDAHGSTIVYGSVFIFKVKEKNEIGMVTYDHLDRKYLSNALFDMGVSVDEMSESMKNCSLGLEGRTEME